MMKKLERNRKYYLYGAGINAFGVVKYLGKKNVLGIIDSNREKIGLEVDGIPIIGIEKYIEEGQEHLVVISAFQKSEEVVVTLQRNGIKNLLVAPYIQAGFLSISEIISYISKKRFGSLVFADTNLLTLLIIDALIEQGTGGCIKGLLDHNNKYITECYNIPVLEEKDVGKDDLILLTELRRENNGCCDKNIVDVLEYVYNNPKMYHKELDKFKNLHRGKRCFIIGTGPSLKMEDLNILAQNNEICFGSNKIYLAFDRTNWRPDYYMLCDFHGFRSFHDIIETFENITVFIEDFYNMLDMDKIAGGYSFHGIHQKDKFRFSKDVTKCIYSGLTVTYDMIQMAVYMGFKEIYLLGVDFSYDAPGSTGNYFSDQYKENIKMQSGFYKNESFLAYQAAEEESYKEDYRIYNATRGGKLEVFERVNFDDLF